MKTFAEYSRELIYPDGLTFSTLGEMVKALPNYVDEVVIPATIQKVLTARKENSILQDLPWKEAPAKVVPLARVLDIIVEAQNEQDTRDLAQVPRLTARQMMNQIQRLIKEDAKVPHVGASEKTEKQLSLAFDALNQLACLGNGDRQGNSEGNWIAQNCLKKIHALDDEALEKGFKSAGKGPVIQNNSTVKVNR